MGLTRLASERPNLDGCRYVYIDVGTNMGIQIRKLFEPHLYPEAEVGSSRASAAPCETVRPPEPQPPTLDAQPDPILTRSLTDRRQLRRIRSTLQSTVSLQPLTPPKLIAIQAESRDDVLLTMYTPMFDYQVHPIFDQYFGPPRERLYDETLCVVG